MEEVNSQLQELQGKSVPKTYLRWLNLQRNFDTVLLQETICYFCLVITCLGGRFEINCPSASLKIWKNHKGDLSQKFPEPNIWSLVNHTKHFTLKLVSLNSGLLQDNSINGAILITTNCYNLFFSVFFIG